MAGDEKLLPAKIDEDKLITIITITVNVVRNGGRGIIVVLLGLLNFFCLCCCSKYSDKLSHTHIYRNIFARKM